MSDGVGSHSGRPAPARLLLLSGGPPWTDAAHAEDGAEIDIVSLPRDAAARLAPSGHGYTHLLIEPALAGDWLSTLIGLTSGEDGSGVALVVLGASALPRDAPVDARFVPQPDAGWLRLATDAPQRSLRDEAPPDIEELREALSSSRLHARYQPIVRISDRAPVGLEVLARFDHPAHGTLRPDLFVPQIEAAGLAWELTRTMLERAFSDWPGKALEQAGLFIAINVPLDVLLIPEAMAFLEQRRSAAGVPAKQVVIELTESRPVERIPELEAATSQLRTLGYGLAIDDVGPDMRDHSALLNLGFTMLKLDKDLVRDSGSAGPTRDFLGVALDAARSAELTVVAEGVETEEIWARMQAAGVDQVQGFLIARPLPARAVPLWREDWSARFGL